MMELSLAELAQIFPDAVEAIIVPAPVVIEFYNDPGPGAPGSYDIKEKRTRLELIRDGIWAGMSEVTHTVFLYIPEEDQV